MIPIPTKPQKAIAINETYSDTLTAIVISASQSGSVVAEDKGFSNL